MSNAEIMPGQGAVILPPIPEITQSREVRYESSKHTITTSRDPIALISLYENNGRGNTEFQILPKDFLLPLAMSKHDAYGNYSQISIQMRKSTESIGSTREAGDYTLIIENLNLALVRDIMREIIFCEYRSSQTTNEWGPFSVILLEYYKKIKDIVESKKPKKPGAIARYFAETPQASFDPDAAAFVAISELVEKRLINMEKAKRDILALYLEQFSLDLAKKLRDGDKEFQLTLDGVIMNFNFDMSDLESEIVLEIKEERTGGEFRRIDNLVFHTRGDIKIVGESDSDTSIVTSQKSVTFIELLELIDSGRVGDFSYSTGTSSFIPDKPDGSLKSWEANTDGINLTIATKKETEDPVGMSVVLGDTEYEAGNDAIKTWTRYPEVIIVGIDGKNEHEGNIEISGMRGEIHLGDISGNVKITNCQGKITFGKVSGNMTLSNCGEVEGLSIGGNFDYMGTNQPSVNNVRGTENIIVTNTR